ncbi:MAG: hypothetical protein AB1351_11110 [Thermoproteota archaeon]
MNRGTRLAIVAGIIIAIAAGATYAAVSAPDAVPEPLAGNGGNNTNSEPRQITVELNESLNVEAK